MESFYSRTTYNLEETTIAYVTKRNGEQEIYNREKIRQRLERLAEGLNPTYINIDAIIHRVQKGSYNGVTTEDLDELSAETCAYMNIIHPDYSILAARIAIDNLHKETKSSFAEIVHLLYTYIDKANRKASMISQDVYEIVQKNKEKIEAAIDYQRDFTYDYFGFKTLERSYLLKIDGKVAERPQHMIMRVAIGIHKDDIDAAIETYNLMSEKWFTHATPTLFNAGTPQPQLSSCFLLTMQNDSLEGIYDTLKQCALISKHAGGIGLAIHCIRASGSYIRGTNGTSNGIVPMLRVFDCTARYVDQGGGKRKGSFAIYLEPWHADIEDFLELRKNFGKEEHRARDLFYALWIPDLFMQRVEQDEDWTLMCPAECPGLQDVYGDDFVELYTKYEKKNMGRKTIKARSLFNQILEAQIEAGMPYMLYKDACNKKSNQQNLGTIKSSNLCTEILQYTDANEVAVCNLASICLPKFVKADKTYDFDKLIQVTRIVVRNLNKVIDLNYYPVKEAETSNHRHRPIGIGVQGLADTLVKMRLEYESEEALLLNEKIFETIYYASCLESMEQAKIHGKYSSFDGSPASQGILQFDFWGKVPTNGYDWDGLKKQIIQHGMRNSLLVAPMPTASTSQIMGNNEGFEAFTSNLYTRRVLAGEFVCINPHLVQDLIDLDLWTPHIKNLLIAYGGSVQDIAEIPQEIRNLYKTVWEISQRNVLNLAVARSPFIDQSQSLNVHIKEPTFQKLSSMHFYAWKKGLKTGMYYLRQRPAADAIKFTLDVEQLLKNAGDIEIAKKNLKTVYNMPTTKSQQQSQNSQKILKTSVDKENISSAANKMMVEENQVEQEEEQQELKIISHKRIKEKMLKAQNEGKSLNVDDFCLNCGS